MLYSHTPCTASHLPHWGPGRKVGFGAAYPCGRHSRLSSDLVALDAVWGMKHRISQPGEGRAHQTRAEHMDVRVLPGVMLMGTW